MIFKLSITPKARTEFGPFEREPQSAKVSLDSGFEVSLTFRGNAYRSGPFHQCFKSFQSAGSIAAFKEAKWKSVLWSAKLFMHER